MRELGSFGKLVRRLSSNQTNQKYLALLVSRSLSVDSVSKFVFLASIYESVFTVKSCNKSSGSASFSACRRTTAAWTWTARQNASFILSLSTSDFSDNSFFWVLMGLKWNFKKWFSFRFLEWIENGVSPRNTAQKVYIPFDEWCERIIHYSPPPPPLLTLNREGLDQLKNANRAAGERISWLRRQK